MKITFNELCKTFALTEDGSERSRHVLEYWCTNHVSSDLPYGGTPAEKYAQEMDLVKHYLDVFLPNVPKDLSKHVAGLDNQTALQYAASLGYDHFIHDTPCTQTLLDEPDTRGMTPLHVAATKGYVHTLTVLLAKGANPRTLNFQAEHPIHQALFVPMLHDEAFIPKKQKILHRLITQAPDTMAHKDNRGDTIFHLMAAQGWTSFMSQLLETHPEGAFYQNNHSHYPIHTAILNNACDVAKTLLAIDKVPLLTDAKQQTPLHYAARYGSKDMVQCCSRFTPDVHCEDNEGKTPLELATDANNTEALQILLERGATYTLKE